MRNLSTYLKIMLQEFKNSMAQGTEEKLKKIVVQIEVTNHLQNQRNQLFNAFTLRLFSQLTEGFTIV